MKRVASLAVWLWMGTAFVGAQQGGKPEPKQLPDKAARLFEMSPDQFLKVFDKNKSGFLERAEAPRFLLRAFTEADANRDDKLERGEIGVMQRLLRGYLVKKGPAPSAGQVVASLLKRYDKDEDGRISTKEAEERLAKAFPFFDRDKDGFLDRKELSAIGEKMAAAARQGIGTERAPLPQPKVDPWDFDAMDGNADGRLTRKELQGTRHEGQFDAIDADGNGRVDPREFEAYRQRELGKED